MLPGQWGLLIIGTVSAAMLGILGWFSYIAFKKEKQRKQRQQRAARREQWHQSLTTAETEERPTNVAKQQTIDSSYVSKRDVSDASEKSKNTRNDFDFKF